MKIIRNIVFFILALVLSACDGTTFQSSVPAYPVRVVIDTRAVFVDFTPENFNAYITVDREGYYENGRFMLPTSAMDAYGYGGVVVYVSMNGYVAFDLGCPACAQKQKKRPCSVDGMYAECPECGEQYELGSGYALPKKGISKEALRPLKITTANGKLTVTQKQ